MQQEIEEVCRRIDQHFANLYALLDQLPEQNQDQKNMGETDCKDGEFAKKV